MAYIKRFHVEGLAGREPPYSVELNRDVNVFCGINGSGKTTLLKILHSALSTDTSILSGLPFKRAEVEVHLNRYNKSFARRFEQPKVLEAPDEAQDSGVHDIYRPMVFIPVKAPAWQSVPPEPEGGPLTVYARGYLPITRLYRSVKRQGKRTGTMSEEELDASFAAMLQRLWASYWSGVSAEVSRAQQRGLANILHHVLSGEEPPSDDPKAPDFGEAYKRVVSFLSRQPGIVDALDSKEEFQRKYESKARVRSVVKQINAIERVVEDVESPRRVLQAFLEAMYAGAKRIEFTDNEVKVTLPDKSEIGLPSLSSGEKQLFYLLLEALRSSSHSLIIDEPELSMHVDWQKRLISVLRALNPDMQLIMATHSPEITADLRDDKVFSL